jgi:hypothetical protein
MDVVVSIFVTYIVLVAEVIWFWILLSPIDSSDHEISAVFRVPARFRGLAIWQKILFVFAAIFVFIGLPIVAGYCGWLFAWQMARRASDLSVHHTFATSYPRIVIDVVAGIYVIWRIVRRRGAEAVKTVWVRTIMDGAVALYCSAWILTFCYHIVVTVPREIEQEASSVPVAMPIDNKHKLSAPSKSDEELATLYTELRGTRLPQKSAQEDFFRPSPPMFSEAHDKFNISAGTVSTTISKENGIWCLIRAAGACLVKPYIGDDGRFYVDAQLLVVPGYGEVRLIKNVLHKNVPEWDSCFNNTSLEVVNDKQTPMFQVIYTTPTDIVINGIFLSGDTLVVASPGELNTHPASQPVTGEEYPVKRIFKYPSRITLCKQLEASLEPAPRRERPYANLTTDEFCGKVLAEADSINRIAEGCLQAVGNQESNEARDAVRKEFSGYFLKCCWQTVANMHDELVYRLKPATEGKGEHLFVEVLHEARHRSTGVELGAVKDISVYLRSLCQQLERLQRR